MNTEQKNPDHNHGRFKWAKRFLFIVPVIFAVAVVAFLVKSQKGPQRHPLQETARSVRVIQAPMANVIPRAVGYGSVQPDQVWQAVAQVSGKVLETSARLKAGYVSPKGELLVRIDPVKYELAVAQAEAGIQSAQAQLTELDFTEKNTRALLEIEQKALALSRKELNRQQQLYQKGTVAGTRLDQQRLSYLAQLSKVRNLENSLRLIPATRKSLEANLQLNKAKLRDAKLDLEYTQIHAPFRCRITQVNIDTSQFVQKGQVLFTADGMETAEITAQIPMYKMRNLLAAKRMQSPTETPWNLDLSRMESFLGLSARVRLKSGTFSAFWDARFVRADATIDAKTRTVGIIVAVDNPYDNIQPGVRPPLVRNMFCEVELLGSTVPDVVIVPRSALHHGEQVYVVNADNRLERRHVEVDFSQDEFVVIGKGLNPNERVVVSDPVPAIEGMLLSPVEDTQLKTQLVAMAGGLTEQQ